jgi:hypothetical protein
MPEPSGFYPVYPSQEPVTQDEAFDWLAADKWKRLAGDKRAMLGLDDLDPMETIYLDETADPFYHAPPPAKSPPIAKDTPKKKRRRGVP